MNLRVVSVLPWATLQDGGRPGYRDRGVPPGGALDVPSLRSANLLLANDPLAPALELPPGRLELRAESPGMIAWAGSPFDVRYRGLPTTVNRIRLEAGDSLTIQAGRQGAAWYLALPGGVRAPRVLGSVSGQRVGTGDLLVAEDPDRPSLVAVRIQPEPLDNAPIRVLPGPAAARLGIDTLTAPLWTVRPESDRRGVRLSGGLRVEFEEAPSEPTVRGAVQVTPDGGAILLGPDGPTVGGYPVVGVVIWSDLARAGQLRPGDAVRLAAVTISEAHEAWNTRVSQQRDRERQLRSLADWS